MDYEAALIEQNGLLGDAIFAADPDTAIPTCPGWSMLQLLRHVGRGDRWAAHIIQTNAGADLDPRTVPEGRPPDDTDGARHWLRTSPVLLLDVIGHVGPEQTVATLVGPRPASWWVRRRLHEATVHRADAALATGQPYHLAPDLAVDGIEEWLERLAVELPASPMLALEDTKSIGLTAPDAGASWTIRGVKNGIEWNRTASDRAADVCLTANAADLFLALVRRRPAPGGVHIEGDHALWTTWLAGTPL